jgi:hypothetical protein
MLHEQEKRFNDSCFYDQSSLFWHISQDVYTNIEPMVHDPGMMMEISLTHRALEEQASALERESRLLWTLSRLILRYANDHPRPRPFAKEQGQTRQSPSRLL